MGYADIVGGRWVRVCITLLLVIELLNPDAVLVRVLIIASPYKFPYTTTRVLAGGAICIRI